MKDYPSINGAKFAPIGEHCLVFNKLDGSNLRCAWTRKKGWHMWGTRTRYFDISDSDFGGAIDIFEKKYAEPLAKAIVDFKDFKKPDEAVAFMEFFGPASFAGWHDPKALAQLGIDAGTNEPKELILFDVNIHKRGMVGPKNFVKAFGHLHTPEVVFDGILTEEFVNDVREGRIVQGEGVVCKCGDGFKHNLKTAKIKTWKYLKLLKERFGVGGYQKYWE